VNRAILSAYDTAWMIKRFFEDQKMSNEALLNETTRYFRIMVCAEPNDTNFEYDDYTVNPKTRYKKTTFGNFY